MDILKRFGIRIKELRLEKNLSQEKLAEIADLHRTYINLIESGKRNISLRNIEKLANALDVNISNLFPNP